MERAVIKQVIGDDVNLKVYINNNNSSDLGREVSDYKTLIERESTDIINPVVDNEVCRFKYNKFSGDAKLLLKFYDGSTGAYTASLVGGGFNNTELKNNSKVLRNSFYVFDFYDKKDTFDREKIFTTYYTQFNVINSDGRRPRGSGSGGDMSVNISDTKQLNYLYIPQWYIDSLENNISDLYMSITFYNAKKGKFIPYLNGLYFDESTKTFTVSTPERMLFRITINKSNKMWYHNDVSSLTVTAFELINAVRYTNKIDKLMNKTDVVSPDTPDVPYFNYTDQKYYNEDGMAIEATGTESEYTFPTANDLLTIYNNIFL